jgi:hypothetical protein
MEGLNEYQQKMIKHVKTEEDLSERIKGLHLILRELRYGPLSLTDQIILSLQPPEIIQKLEEKLNLEITENYKSMIKHYKENYFTFDCSIKDIFSCLHGYLETGNQEGINKCLLELINQGFDMEKKNFLTDMYIHAFAYGNFDVIKKYIPETYIINNIDLYEIIDRSFLLVLETEVETETMKNLLENVNEFFDANFVENENDPPDYLAELAHALTISIGEDKYADMTELLFKKFILEFYNEQENEDIEEENENNERIVPYGEQFLWDAVEGPSVKNLKVLNNYIFIKRILLNEYNNIFDYLFDRTFDELNDPRFTNEYDPADLFKFLLETWRKNYPDLDPRDYISEENLKEIEMFSIHYKLYETYLFFLNKTIPSLYYITMKSLDESKDLSSSYIIPPPPSSTKTKYDYKYYSAFQEI